MSPKGHFEAPAMFQSRKRILLRYPLTKKREENIFALLSVAPISAVIDECVIAATVYCTFHMKGIVVFSQ